MFWNAWWPTRQRHRQRCAGWPTSSCCSGSRGRSCPTPNASCSARAIEAPRTGLPPTAHCWMSWSTCSDRCPRRGARSVLFLDLDSEIPEVVTTADLLSPAARGRSVRAPARDLRAPARRRGARCQPHAVADAAPARRQRQLDDRRRSCAELLDRQPRRPIARSTEIIGTAPGTALPDEHELSQPVGGLRPGRQGRGRRLPRRRPARGRPLHRPSSLELLVPPTCPRIRRSPRP